MTKFSSFLVFAFGLALIIGTIVTIVRKEFFPEPPPPPEERVEIPKTDMEPLDAGTREQFQAHLDKIFASGGLEAIHDYVEKEWVPGRLVRGTIFSSAGVTEARIIDREVRRCSRDGIALMEKTPLLARGTPNLRVGSQVRLESWTRKQDLGAFNLTVWFVGR